MIKSVIRYLKNPSLIKEYFVRKHNMNQIKMIVRDFEAVNKDTLSYFNLAIEEYVKGGGFRYNRNFQLYKLISIYSILQKHQPSSVLELGSGSTTSVLNHWSKDNETKVTVFEESDKWMENTKGIISRIGGLSPRLNMTFNKRMMSQEKPIEVFRYTDIYKDQLDILIIDGPSTLVDGDFKAEVFTDDLDEMLNFNYPKVILIDNRKSTYAHLKKKISDKYHMKPSSNWTLKTERMKASDMNNYSILTLK